MTETRSLTPDTRHLKPNMRNLDSRHPEEPGRICYIYNKLSDLQIPPCPIGVQGIK
jgi:hypothetical protein